MLAVLRVRSPIHAPTAPSRPNLRDAVGDSPTSAMKGLKSSVGAIDVGLQEALSPDYVLVP